VDSF
jgi:hypothetical protein